ncbi:hypothetical protein QMY03_09495 [Arthrobacter sp. KFRI-F3372]|uniref:hypothetical protein n=1 Tax=Arthrobacter oryzae TaxID=409290 RepID=UPI00278289CC|nr:hypothetical protein [Arthrobacter oryzae]MDP9989196.1 hypothetical protein [Arthrobacter oryzae]WHP61111.1 hypothetical protein QMY03_09495 [Arthrobacter sp. KFRI-F3372]
MLDAEYVQRVRRHAPSQLLPLVAQLGSSFTPGQTIVTIGGVMVTPWALADIARVSLVHGREHRGATALLGDVLECVSSYNNLDDPDLAAQKPGAVTNLVLRLAGEQLVYNLPPQATVSRSVAMLEQTVPSRTLRIMRPGWAEELLGGSVADFVGTGFLLQTACGPNAGSFDLSWVEDRNPLGLDEYMDLATVREIMRTQFTSTLKEFKLKNADHYHPGPYRRFSHNPLLNTPAISGVIGNLVIPVAPMITRKISPQGIYYAGTAKWGNTFAEEMGDLFEQYVGRQLQLVPDALVYPEITYGPQRRKTIDWFVVLDNAVLLIEVKSVRPTDPVRMADTRSSEELSRMLGKAFEQINRTSQLMDDGQPELALIPSSLPRIGLVITMEDFHVVNSTLVRNLYRTDEGVPSFVASIAELEWAVTLQRALDAFLLDLVNDPESQGWSIRSRFGSEKAQVNSVIEEAWQAHPFTKIRVPDK